MQPLPQSWVDRIFDKLSITYGKGFVLMYEGLDPNAVKANWAHELAGFYNKPEAIKHALEHLPLDRVPNVLQFRAICIGMPPPVFKALPAPAIDRAKVQELLAKAKAAITKV